MPQYAYTEEANDKQEELESVRNEISEVESGLLEARNESEQLYAGLQELESTSLSLQQTLDQLNTELSASDKKIAELDKQQKTANEEIEQARKKLAQQLRTTYITGRHNMLKLVLNQEDPAQLSRLIAYHDYFNQARSQQITTIDESLLHIAELKQQIIEESQSNRDLRQAQKSRLAEIAAIKLQRENLLQQLNHYITDQDNHLQTLRKTEAELSQLLEDLSDDSPVISGFENVPPFATLQGKLSLPVRGKIDTTFGEYKKGGRMRAMGVTFNTKIDAEVKAVAGGQVIFADWFRNLGLLLIIDHGDDYMSLYGHNASISKKKGDWVEAGDVISMAGETGGRQNTSLYFEIRKNGTPLNPLKWCKR